MVVGRTKARAADIATDLLPTSEVSSLVDLDWDFAGARTDYSTHGIHPYPAKFIPQIPNALIQELSSAGDTVLDIFCGSGTTLVEALVLNRRAIGIDANPLACLISRAKTTPIDTRELAELNNLVAKSQEYAASASYKIPDLLSETPFKSDAPRPSHDCLEFWFEPFVVEELAEIKSWCMNLSTPAARQLALTSFSAIIVAASKQDSDTRYVRREKKLAHGGVFSKFARALAKATKAASELSDIVKPNFHCNVYQENLLDKPNVPSADLVVCSPPYPNAYSYHLYHMTRMVWLDMNQPKFKQEEIGSHRKYSNKGKNAATVDTFKQEFRQILAWLKTVLRGGRYACFVMGDSTLRGERIDNSELISKEACEVGFLEVGRLDRTLQVTKKAFNPSIGKIKKEKILILRNEM